MEKRSAVSGSDAARLGYRYQALCLLWEALERHDWRQVWLEERDASDPDGKADIRWDTERGLVVDQAKSQARPFSDKELRKWSADLERIPAQEHRLLLIGRFGTRVRMRPSWKVLSDSADALRERCALRLVGGDYGTTRTVEQLLRIVDESVLLLNDRSIGGGTWTPGELKALIAEAAERAAASSEFSPLLSLEQWRTVVARRDGLLHEVVRVVFSNNGNRDCPINLTMYWTDAENSVLLHGAASEGQSINADWNRRGAGPEFSVAVSPPTVVPAKGVAWWAFIVERTGVIRTAGDRRWITDRLYGQPATSVRHRVELIVEGLAELEHAKPDMVDRRGDVLLWEMSAQSHLDLDVAWMHRAAATLSAEAREVLRSACEAAGLDRIPQHLLRGLR